MTARAESGNTVRSVSRQRPLLDLPAYNDWDLLVRTSWVDADVAYKQIRKVRLSLKKTITERKSTALSSTRRVIIGL